MIINRHRRRRTLSVVLFQHLVHILQLLLPLLHKLLLLLFTPLDPFPGIIYVAIGFTESRTLELCVEFAPVSHPMQ